MKHMIVKNGVKLLIGYILYALGVVFNIQANIGLSPWNVFNEGLSKLTGITIGESIIVVGVLIVICTSFFKEKVGVGTIGNMILIGVFTDIILENNIVPEVNHIILQVGMLALGMFTIGVASYFYLSVELGSGPRDGLMVLLAKKTKYSVRVIRSGIEILVLIIGIILGGRAGIGTLFNALFIGYFVQLAFKIFKFDISKINHRFIDEQIKMLLNKRAS